jgi:hypothetical protein
MTVFNEIRMNQTRAQLKFIRIKWPFFSQTMNTKVSVIMTETFVAVARPKKRTTTTTKYHECNRFHEEMNYSCV